MTNARVYYTTRAAAGASAPGIPHALWAENLARLGRIAPREGEALFLTHKDRLNADLLGFIKG